MDENVIYQVQLHNHKRRGDNEWGNYCGFSIYEQSYLDEETGEEIEDYENEIWYPSKDYRFVGQDLDFMPYAWEVRSFTNDDVGTYTYNVQSKSQ